MKRVGALVGLLALSVFAFSEVKEADLVGTWSVDVQIVDSTRSLFEEYQSLQAFTGNGVVKPLKSLTFLKGGIASVLLSDGTTVASFYKALKYGIRLQLQGGKETLAVIFTLPDGKLLVSVPWTYPDSESTQLLLILSKSP